MAYYKTNAIYQELNNTQQQNFAWLSGNAWMLLYGNKSSTTKLIVFVKGKSFIEDRANDSKNQFFLENFCQLSQEAKLPFIEIIFDDSIDSIETVQVRTSPQSSLEEISSTQLRQYFHDIGLEVLTGECAKYVNDRTSSAYHSWQRNNLGHNIIVSDIDLVRFENSQITEIIELKRSHYALDRWIPFREDYANFNLISDFCEKSSISRFLIVYNVRTTKPWYDDPSQVSIFSYSRHSRPTHIAIVPLQQFINNNY